MTAEIIHVDFKTRKKIQKPESEAPEEEIKTYNWLDSVTGIIHTFDSSRQDNTMMVEVPLWCRFDEGLKQIPFTFDVKEFTMLLEDLKKLLED